MNGHTSPSSTSFGNIPGNHSGKSNKGHGGMELEINSDPIRSTPGTSPPLLGGRTGRDQYGACVGKGQTKFNQGRGNSVESLSTAPSRAGKDASSGRKQRCWSLFFFLFNIWELLKVPDSHPWILS